jgi:acyl-CoA:acyl-CoA alkyltransferase
MRRYEHVAIAGLGYALPESIVTSRAIEDRLAPLYDQLGLSAGRIEFMTGVRERRFWAVGTRPSQVALQAAQQAFLKASVSREDVGAIIHASVCRDFLEPATANVVHHALGLPSEALVFDLSNACLGVMSGMLLIADMIERGQIRAGLVVSGEDGRSLVDSTVSRLLRLTGGEARRALKTAFASLTIGSGAAAILLAQKSLVPEAPRLEGLVSRNATEHHALCVGGVASEGETACEDVGLAGGATLTMRTDSERLMRAGVKLADEAWRAFCEGAPEYQAPDRVIAHQVGSIHHRMLMDTLRLSEETSFTTYESLGNMGSASWPITLALAVQSGFVREGDRVALMGIGSGLSAMMGGVRW